VRISGVHLTLTYKIPNQYISLDTFQLVNHIEYPLFLAIFIHSFFNIPKIDDFTYVGARFYLFTEKTFFMNNRLFRFQEHIIEGGYSFRFHCLFTFFLSQSLFPDTILCIVWMKLHRGVIERMEIPAMRCLTCGKYYIHEDQYQKYRAMGRFICQIVRREYWLDPDSSEIETCRFYPTSLLMDCGYTVKASIGVPEEVRRRILRDVVDSGLMTRFQIVSHIRQQMDIHWDCREAIDKWRGDMEYIAEYKKEELDKVEANAFLLSIYRK